MSGKTQAIGYLVSPYTFQISAMFQANARVCPRRHYDEGGNDWGRHLEDWDRAKPTVHRSTTSPTSLTVQI